MNKGALFVVALLFLSCNTGSNTNAVSVKDIMGIWTDGGSENATFEIQRDSIFYVDNFETYKYSLKGDSIMIKTPDDSYAARVSFSKDTMVMDSKDGVTRYWKFKN